MDEQLGRDQQESDRQEAEASRNIYGLRSLLDPGLCQYCGSVDGMIKVWDNPEDITDDSHHLENCPVCNPTPAGLVAANAPFDSASAVINSNRKGEQ